MAYVKPLSDFSIVAFKKYLGSHLFILLLLKNEEKINKKKERP